MIPVSASRGEERELPLQPPPISLLRNEQILIKEWAVNTERLASEFRVPEVVRRFTQLQENEMGTVTSFKNNRDSLCLVRDTKERLLKELAAVEANAIKIINEENLKTEAVARKYDSAGRKVSNYDSLVDRWNRKINGLRDRIKDDEIIKLSISQFLEDQGMQCVVDPDSGKISSIKFWNIDAARPKAECVIFFKTFDVTNLSLFEADSVSPMFPEFEEISKRASESKNFTLLVSECVRHWKSKYTRTKRP